MKATQDMQDINDIYDMNDLNNMIDMNDTLVQCGLPETAGWLGACRIPC